MKNGGTESLTDNFKPCQIVRADNKYLIVEVALENTVTLMGKCSVFRENVRYRYFNQANFLAATKLQQSAQQLGL